MEQHFYRNAGTGDNVGVRVNLNPRRPKFHAARPDWIRSGRALCGADISRPGWTSTNPGTDRTCADCLKKLQEPTKG